MPDNDPHNLLRHHVSGAIERGEAKSILGISAPHFHVASGLAGYGPDASDTDGFACFASLSEALEYVRDELSTYIDFAHDGAHGFAHQGDYESAWTEVVRMEDLELWRANLDPSRRSAPLYRDDAAAYAAMQAEQAAQFPRDVSHNSRLYLWDCSDDCESSQDWEREQ